MTKDEVLKIVNYSPPPKGRGSFLLHCNVGAKTAIDLLEHFGTIERVVTASAEELQEVSGIGRVTAEKLRSLILERY